MVDAEVKAICEEAVQALAEQGGRVEEAAPDWECPDQLFFSHLAPRMAVWLEDSLPQGFREQLDPMIDIFIPRIDEMSAREVVRAHFGPDRIWATLGPFFATYDLWLTPTVGAPAWDRRYFGPNLINGREIPRPLYPFFTFPFNMTGQPAASTPAGFTAAGLPVGLQIIGRRYREDTVLKAAARLEEARPWQDRWPDMVT
jgi:aspartyl-tRNA(Asn)/glutamyl-tRNA(Gln) amidotransferase subunit A